MVSNNVEVGRLSPYGFCTILPKVPLTTFWTFGLNLLLMVGLDPSVWFKGNLQLSHWKFAATVWMVLSCLVGLHILLWQKPFISSNRAQTSTTSNTFGINLNDCCTQWIPQTGIVAHTFVQSLFEDIHSVSLGYTHNELIGSRWEDREHDGEVQTFFTSSSLHIWPPASWRENAHKSYIKKVWWEGISGPTRILNPSCIWFWGEEVTCNNCSSIVQTEG